MSALPPVDGTHGQILSVENKPAQNSDVRISHQGNKAVRSLNGRISSIGIEPVRYAASDFIYTINDGIHY